MTFSPDFLDRIIISFNSISIMNCSTHTHVTLVTIDDGRLEEVKT